MFYYVGETVLRPLLKYLIIVLISICLSSKANATTIVLIPGKRYRGHP